MSNFTRPRPGSLQRTTYFLHASEPQLCSRFHRHGIPKPRKLLAELLTPCDAFIAASISFVVFVCHPVLC